MLTASPASRRPCVEVQSQQGRLSTVCRSETAARHESDRGQLAAAHHTCCAHSFRCFGVRECCRPRCGIYSLADASPTTLEGSALQVHLAISQLLRRDRLSCELSDAVRDLFTPLRCHTCASRRRVRESVAGPDSAKNAIAGSQTPEVHTGQKALHRTACARMAT